MKFFTIQIGSKWAALGISLLALGCGDKEEAGNGGTGGAKVDLEAQMAGYWMPNAAASAELIQKENPDDPSAAAGAQMAAAMITLEVKKGEVILHAMGQARPGTYKLTRSDPAKKMLVLEITDQEGTEEGTATIEGDKLTYKRGEDSLVFDRISKDEFEKRKKGSFPALDNLPEDLTPPIPPPGE